MAIEGILHPVIKLHQDERNIFEIKAIQDLARDKLNSGGALALTLTTSNTQLREEEFKEFWNILLSSNLTTEQYERIKRHLNNLTRKLIGDCDTEIARLDSIANPSSLVIADRQASPHSQTAIAQAKKQLEEAKAKKARIEHIANNITNNKDRPENIQELLKVVAGNEHPSSAIDVLHQNERNFLAKLKQQIVTRSYDQSDVDTAISKYQERSQLHLNDLLDQTDSSGNPYFSPQERSSILADRKKYYEELKQQLKTLVDTDPIASFFAEQYKAAEEKSKTREHRHLTSTSLNKWRSEQASSSTTETESESHRPSIDTEGDMSHLSLPKRPLLPRQSVANYHFKNPWFGQEKLAIPKFRITETETSLTFHALGEFGQVNDRLFTSAELVEGYSRLIENALAKGMIPPLGLSRLKDENLDPNVRDAVLKFAARCGILPNQIRNYTMSPEQERMYEAELAAWKPIVTSSKKLTELVQKHAAGFISGDINLKPENFIAADESNKKRLFENVAGTQERIAVLSSSALPTAEKITLLQPLLSKPKELAQVLNGLNSSALSTEFIANMITPETSTQWKSVLSYLSIAKISEYFSQLPAEFQNYLWKTQRITPADRAHIISKSNLTPQALADRVVDYAVNSITSESAKSNAANAGMSKRFVGKNPVFEKNFIEFFKQLSSEKKAEVFSALVHKEPLFTSNVKIGILSRNTQKDIPFSSEKKAIILKQLYEAAGPDSAEQKEFFNALDGDARLYLLNNPSNKDFLKNVSVENKPAFVAAVARMDSKTPAYTKALKQLTDEEKELVNNFRSAPPMSADSDLIQLNDLDIEQGSSQEMESLASPEAPDEAMSKHILNAVLNPDLSQKAEHPGFNQAYIASFTKPEDLIRITQAIFRAQNSGESVTLRAAAANPPFDFSTTSNQNFKALSKAFSTKQRYDLVTTLLSASGPHASHKHTLAAVIMSDFTPEQQMALIQAESDLNKKKTLLNLIALTVSPGADNTTDYKFKNNYGTSAPEVIIPTGESVDRINENSDLLKVMDDNGRAIALKAYKENPRLQFQLMHAYLSEQNKAKEVFALLDAENQSKLLEIQYITIPGDARAKLDSINTLLSGIDLAAGVASHQKLADIFKHLDSKIMKEIIGTIIDSQNLAGVLGKMIPNPDAPNPINKDKFIAAFRSISDANKQLAVFNVFTKPELKVMVFPHLNPEKQNAVIRDSGNTLDDIAKYLSNPMLPVTRAKELFALINNDTRALAVYSKLGDFSREEALFSKLPQTKQIEALTGKDAKYQIAVIKTLPDDTDKNHLRVLFEKMPLPAALSVANAINDHQKKARDNEIAQKQTEFFRALNQAQQDKLINRDGWNGENKLSDAAVKSILLGSNQVRAKDLYEKLSDVDKRALATDDSIQRHINPPTSPLSALRH